MVLVTGGVYQGKLDFAKDAYELSDADIFFCDENNATLDFDKKCIYGLEKFILAQVRADEVPSTYIRCHMVQLRDKIIIGADVSCGVVPIADDLRLWREECGRVYTTISLQASQVVRLFCGIPTIIKN